MSRPRKYVVFGPLMLWVTLAGLALLGVALVLLGQPETGKMILAAVISRILPFARGRPGDRIKLVTRGTGARFRRPPSAAPPPQHPEQLDES